MHVYMTGACEEIIAYHVRIVGVLLSDNGSGSLHKITIEIPGIDSLRTALSNTICISSVIRYIWGRV